MKKKKGILTLLATCSLLKKQQPTVITQCISVVEKAMVRWDGSF